ncbi:MAG TPA: M13 family metallopeptidase [Pyrinomonadaceae bacterium]|nr:M13 family metallopeptidase [Pyrinomonadaceae bacterium]
MHSRILSPLAPLILALALACAPSAAARRQQSPAPKAIDPADMDLTVRPGEDFYRYANGNWVRKNPIPAGQSRWGAFDELDVRTAEKLRAILDETLRDAAAPKGSARQLLRDFYKSAMDTEAVERAGASPLKPYFERIDALRTKDELAALVGEFHKTVAPQAVFLYYRDADVENPGRRIAALRQGGLALPNRSYYLRDDAESAKLREQYRAHVERVFRLLGDSEADAKTNASAVLKVETALASHSLTREEERDPKLTFNRMTLAELQKAAPHFNWANYFAALGLPPTRPVNVVTPGFFRGLSEMTAGLPLAEWKTYLRWNVLKTNARLLSSDFVKENFDFFDRTLQGVTEMQPRWQMVQAEVESQLGWALGREYVARHFSPRAKERMLTMIGDIREAFARRIRALDWMGEETKRKALAKLDKITVNVGYPDRWPDLDGLDIRPDGYLANVVRVTRRDVERSIRKLGEPADRGEFGMTPQTVNAYYNPAENKIVFPAAILQPPVFHESFDRAVNYGGIGSVIAHEFTHAFDDEGSQYDGDGRLANWWTAEDLARFKEKQRLVVEQYSGYTALDGLRLNGELTVGENIADLGGVHVAFDAFEARQRREGRAPLIDGLTPEQRFFVAWARVWRVNMTPEAVRLKVNTSTTSYAPFRVNGPFSNHEGFIKAFGLKDGDPMVRPAAKRIRIW